MFLLSGLDWARAAAAYPASSTPSTTAPVLIFRTVWRTLALPDMYPPVFDPRESCLAADARKKTRTPNQNFDVTVFGVSGFPRGIPGLEVYTRSRFLAQLRL